MLNGVFGGVTSSTRLREARAAQRGAHLGVRRERRQRPGSVPVGACRNAQTIVAMSFGTVCVAGSTSSPMP